LPLAFKYCEDDPRQIRSVSQFLKGIPTPAAIFPEDSRDQMPIFHVSFGNTHFFVPIFKFVTDLARSRDGVIITTMATALKMVLNFESYQRKLPTIEIMNQHVVSSQSLRPWRN
jgi:hypothetical protein